MQEPSPLAPLPRKESGCTINSQDWLTEATLKLKVKPLLNYELSDPAVENFSLLLAKSN